MTLDELLLEWSYRSEKGYPSLDSPSDISLLKEILGELGIPAESIIDELEGEEEEIEVDPDQSREKEPEPKPEPEEKPQDTTVGDAQYDAIIRKHLGLSDDQPLPRVENTYPFPGTGGATFDIQVKDKDLKHWQDFWTLTPPKAGGEIGDTSKGSGDGELSLYWLYQHSNSADVKGTQGSDNPDLTFNSNVGVEVKAYGPHSKVKGLGRWSIDKDQLDALGILFGFQKLINHPDLIKRLPQGGGLVGASNSQMYVSFDKLLG